MPEYAWHFVGEKLRDGRPIPEDGEWLEHTGEIVWCESGLYASRTAWDALQYSPGATLCRVEVEGVEREDKDKFVCRRRRIVQRVDLTETLREFARWCALRVAHLWDCPKIVREYLETGDESKRDAARDAAWAAARDAARDAARAAARAAAWDAAWDAARDAQKQKFEEMVSQLFA